MGRRNRTVKSTQAVEARRLDQEWRTGLYARLSCENNNLEDDRSLVNQVEYDREYVTRHPTLKLVDEYVDNGHTGTNFERPDFMRLMEDLKTGRINCIVVKDLSRFGRNYLETGYYLEKIFPYLNIRFIAINDHYDSMDAATRDNLVVPIKNLVNEMYSRDISRKITSTMRMKEKKGEIWYGVAPYGYLKDAETPFHMAVDEDTAPYVKLMFTWALQDMSYGEIAFRLNEIGAETPSQRMERMGSLRPDAKRNKDNWGVTTVKGILNSPIYIGDTFYNRTRQSVIEGTKERRMAREEWFVIPDTHEALVSKEDFSRLSEILAKRKQKQIDKEEKTSDLRAETPDVLSGLFYCSDCGRRMVYSRDIRKGEVRRCDYYCSGFRFGRAQSRCKKIEFSDRLIRTLVLDQIRLQVQASCRVFELSREMEKSDVNRNAQEKLEAQVADLNQKLLVLSAKRHRLYEDFADGVLTEEDYKDIKTRYDGQFHQQTEELMKAEKELEAVKSVIKPEPEWTELVEKIGQTGRLTYEIAHEMISRVEIGSDMILRVTFRHKDWMQELAEMEARLT
ncbi:MAG: recombinase family protein [Tannerellaceae bacterium]|nr:recombinase family protein [Tannerellaceae bacterium]